MDKSHHQNLRLNQNDKYISPIEIPTLLVFFSGMFIWMGSFFLRLLYSVSSFITIPISILGVYLLFHVAHDSTHGSISRYGFINDYIGSICFIPFYFAPFHTFKYLHLQHHYNLNIPHLDPDYNTSGYFFGNKPLLGIIFHIFYYYLYFFSQIITSIIERLCQYKLFNREHKIKSSETNNNSYRINTKNNKKIFNDKKLKKNLKIFIWTIVIIVIHFSITIISYYKGFLNDVMVLWIIPAYLSIIILSYLFDYLPHRDHKFTIQTNKYKATNMTEGIFNNNPNTQLLSILTLNQLTYHNIHHLYPRIPFYRYPGVWIKQKEELINRGTPIQSIF